MPEILEKLKKLPKNLYETLFGKTGIPEVKPEEIKPEHWEFLSPSKKDTALKEITPAQPSKIVEIKPVKTKATKTKTIKPEITKEKPVELESIPKIRLEKPEFLQEKVVTTLDKMKETILGTIRGKVAPWDIDYTFGLSASIDLNPNFLLKTAIMAYQRIPSELKEEIEKNEKIITDLKEDRKNYVNEIINTVKEISDKKIQILQDLIEKTNDIYSELMKQIPKLEPDEKTQLARNLAMALMAISGFVHPSYSPYFYMAIPQIVEYWRNEDKENFQLAMSKFNSALNIAQLKLNHLADLANYNLEILEAEAEKQLTPTKLALQETDEVLSYYLDKNLDLSNAYLDTYLGTADFLTNIAKILGDWKLRERVDELKELTSYIRLYLGLLSHQLGEKRLALQERREKRLEANEPLNRALKEAQYNNAILRGKLLEKQLQYGPYGILGSYGPFTWGQ